MNNNWHYMKSNYLRQDLSDLTRKMGYIYSHNQTCKEIGQNVIDVRLSSDKPAKIYMDLIKVEKNQKTSFLEQIGVDKNNFIENLNRMSYYRKTGKERFQMMINLLKDDHDFCVLRIININTEGLTGDIDDKESHIYGFYRLIGLSNKGEFATGSYGEGRMAILRTSKLQLVVSVSYLSTNEKYRVFGTLIHGLFEQNGEEYSGVGYFGEKTNHNKYKPINFDVFQDNNLLFPNILRNQVYGDAFYYPFFDFKQLKKDGIKDEEILKKWTEKFFNSFQNWFFPAIYNDQLEVIFRHFNYPKIRKAQDGTILKKLNKETIADVFTKLLDSNDSKSAAINFKIPKSTPRGYRNKSETHEFKFIEIDEDKPLEYLMRNNIHNRIILGRNNMVIKYEEMKEFHPHNPFLGYFMVGKEKELSLKFFRYAETPQHDDWTYTDRLKAQYGEYSAQNTLRELIKKLKLIIKENFGYDDSSDDIDDVIKDFLRKYIHSEFEIKEETQGKPRELEIKETKPSKGKPGPKTGETPPPSGSESPEHDESDEEEEGDKEDEREFQDGMDPDGNIKIATLEKTDRYDILEELEVELLENRKVKNFKKSTTLKISIKAPQKLKSFSHIYIEALYEIDKSGSDWGNLPIYFKGRKLPVSGLKVINSSLHDVFPVIIEIDFSPIPSILRDKLYLLPRAYTCKIKKGDAE